jgi:hypothetical protein
MKQLISSLKLGAALVAALLTLSAVPAFAQTVLTSTTLAAAITDTSGTTVTVTSATGFTANTTGFLIDREFFAVRVVNGTTITATRGQSGTRAATHVNGAAIFVGPQYAFQDYIPGGQCTRTNLLYVPWIVVGDRDPSNNGNMYDCLGVTTAGQWARVDSNDKPVLGSTVASTAGVITATGTIFKVSGTSAITGITLPAGAQPGFTLQVEPTGVFTWTTATNIILAGTAVVGKILYFVWDGAKWVPSYIA